MDFIRRAFSKKKRRFVDQDFNLDLSYITPRIIAMSYPASGFSKLYRNPIDEVAKFLEAKHESHFKVFNLAEVSYDHSKFHNRVIDIPWPDHHAPPLELLFVACMKIHQWLLGSPKSVVVINCLAGKGRTGTVICAYLLFSGRLTDVQQALDYFKFKRFKSFSEESGVTQPSQVRYVTYFNQILTGQVVKPQLKYLRRISIGYGQAEFTPVTRVSVNGKIIYLNQASSRAQQERSLVADEQSKWSVSIERVVYGDVFCQFLHWGRLGLKEVCRLTFHAAFVPNEQQLTFTIDDLDPFRLRNLKEWQAGSITLEFEPMQCCVDSACRRCTKNLEEESRIWENIHTILAYRSQLLVPPSQVLFTEEHADDIEAVLAYRHGRVA
jgi:phosphatidylinositol-3,4,5-trisphosphate 3-phosphatase/dual-specificity protein phosphatase PTEN